MSKLLKPYLDLRPINAPYLEAFEYDLAKCIADNAYINGPAVEEFEHEYARYIGTEFCVGVGNGTDALFLILTALGIGLGNDVLVQAHTCDATWMAVAATGARPIPVDVRLDTLNINADLLPALLTPQTKAVIGVHMNGNPIEIEAVLAFCTTHKLHFIEDNAQATGAKYHGQRTGSFGIAAAHSFYPTKPLGALGDGGAITTADGDLAARIRSLANYGKPFALGGPRLAGYNSRLDDLQARFLLRKLPFVDAARDDRAANAQAYAEHLDGFDLQYQHIAPGVHSAYHLFTVLHPERDVLKRMLLDIGIETAIHYPQAPHQLSLFGYSDANAPIAAQIARQTLSLPL
jgi:dTDP-4-amino-4,6-dideoxygalactose transaminase